MKNKSTVAPFPMQAGFGVFKRFFKDSSQVIYTALIININRLTLLTSAVV